MHWRPRPRIIARSRRLSSLMAAGLYVDGASIVSIRYRLTKRFGGEWTTARAWREVRFGQDLIAGHLEARRQAHLTLKRRRPELFPPQRTAADRAARASWHAVATAINAQVRRKEFVRDSESL